MSTWIRGYVSGASYGRQTYKLASLLNGSSVLRVHYGISMDGFFTSPGTVTQSQIAASMTNATGFGIVTQRSTVTGGPPSPLTHSFDAVPPMQRWLHLAVAAPTLNNFNSATDTWTMAFRSTWENNDTKGQVTASGLGSSETLDVWLSIDSALPGWPTPTPTDIAWYTAWWSVLVRP